MSTPKRKPPKTPTVKNTEAIDKLHEEVETISNNIDGLTQTVTALAEIVTQSVDASHQRHVDEPHDIPAPESGTLAKNHPVRLERYGTDDYPVGQDHERAMQTRGPAHGSLEPARIEPVPSVTREQAENLKFMEEELTVKVHDTTNENDDPFPVVWNGGRSQYFIRGQEQPVKRKFVEILARSKLTTYSQKKVVNANGDDTYVQIPHTALRFPFSVTEDPAGARGKLWLQNVLSEA